MRNSIKGVLLSGLVYPGLGQMMLKKYMRGIMFILVTTICLIAFIISATQAALVILEKIQTGGGLIDMNMISNAAAQAAAGSYSGTMIFSLLLLLVAWLIGIIDSYFIGKKMDNEPE